MYLPSMLLTNTCQVWKVFKCSFTKSLITKVLLHFWHVYLLPLCIVSLCLHNCCLLANESKHTSHQYGYFLLRASSMCLLHVWGVRNSFWQNLQMGTDFSLHSCSSSSFTPAKILLQNRHLCSLL